MEGAPVFEEFAPASDCDCPGCIHRRRSMAHTLPVRQGGHPAAHGARRALVIAAAAGTVLGGGQVLPAAASGAPGVTGAPGVPGVPRVPGAPADEDPEVGGPGPGSPQGGTSALHGAPGAPGAPGTAASAARTTTRAEILARAKKWVAAKVPYSMNAFWADGYRQDCSGFVSMAWNLGGNEWTGSLSSFAVRITKSQLQPGDILLFHNPANPEKGSHVTIFGGWANAARTQYVAYEQARPAARKQTTPYAYWSNGGSYLAYRYKGVKSGAPGGAGPSTGTRYPGAGSFGPGADNKYVTQLGKALVGRGGARFYKTGPGPRWSDADRRATQAFQRAQGWTGGDADGLPGAATWSYLMTGKGRDIPRAGAGGGSPGKAPAYPGSGVFRPGQSSPSIERLGRQLVKKGYGRHYARGPGPRWSESDRRNVEAFQRAQGWRGAAADGYPGPETWRRLFA
ncbi:MULTISPECIES: peptidoglycan-binding protein [unclassified Streptomyces]|uniref:peptidoglycan-binding protein n=1 Tax=Streptomyces sp. SYP-A7185 TaxID=3040076 RepID=UPI0038F80805